LKKIATDFVGAAPVNGPRHKMKVFVSTRSISKFLSFSVERLWQKSPELVVLRMNEYISGYNGGEEEQPPKCLCYCRIGSVQFLVRYLRNVGVVCEAIYSGKEKEASDKLKKLEKFRSGEIQVLCVDKAFNFHVPDIRFVFHLFNPSTLRDYVYETSFAGKDMVRSFCVLFYLPQNNLFDREDSNGRMTTDRAGADVLRYVTTGCDEDCRYGRLVRCVGGARSREGSTSPNFRCDPGYGVCDNCVSKNDGAFRNDTDCTGPVGDMLQELIRRGEGCGEWTRTEIINLISGSSDASRHFVGRKNRSVGVRLIHLLGDLGMGEVNPPRQRRLVAKVSVGRRNAGAIGSFLKKMEVGAWRARVAPVTNLRRTAWDCRTYFRSLERLSRGGGGGGDSQEVGAGPGTAVTGADDG